MLPIRFVGLQGALLATIAELATLDPNAPIQDPWAFDDIPQIAKRPRPDQPSCEYCSEPRCLTHIKAGLATGYFLRRHKLNYRIIDGEAEPADAWHHSWELLHLFSPEKWSSLSG